MYLCVFNSLNHFIYLSIDHSRFHILARFSCAHPIVAFLSVHVTVSLPSSLHLPLIFYAAIFLILLLCPKLTLPPISNASLTILPYKSASVVVTFSPPIYLFIHLFVYLSVYSFLYLSIYPSLSHTHTESASCTRYFSPLPNIAHDVRPIMSGSSLSRKETEKI